MKVCYYSPSLEDSVRFDGNLQDGKSPWLRPRGQAGLPRDVRVQAGIQAGSQMAGGCTLCLRDPKGKDWGQRTGATGDSTPGLGKALENPSGAAGEREHHSGTGMLPCGRSWRFRTGLSDFISSCSRNGHLPFVLTATLVQSPEVQPWSSVPIPNSAIFGVTLQEKEY